MTSGAVHSSSFMSQLQYSSVSLINSHDSITAAKGMVEAERFLVPLGKSQERLRASVLESAGCQKRNSNTFKTSQGSHSFICSDNSFPGSSLI